MLHQIQRNCLEKLHRYLLTYRIVFFKKLNILLTHFLLQDPKISSVINIHLVSNPNWHNYINLIQILTSIPQIKIIHTFYFSNRVYNLFKRIIERYIRNWLKIVCIMTTSWCCMTACAHTGVVTQSSLIKICMGESISTSNSSILKK